MDWGTGNGPTQSQEHQLSLWLLHSDPYPSCTQRIRGRLHAGPDLLLCQAGGPSESRGAPKGENQDPTLLGTGRENTRTLPKLNGDRLIILILFKNEFTCIFHHHALKMSYCVLYKLGIISSHQRELDFKQCHFDWIKHCNMISTYLDVFLKVEFCD